MFVAVDQAVPFPRPGRGHFRGGGRRFPTSEGVIAKMRPGRRWKSSSRAFMV